MREKQWIFFFIGILSVSFIIAVCGDKTKKTSWSQKYITEVPSIIMKDPFLELLGQTDKPVPYTYDEAVKLSGHSCGAVAGAWIITKKALKALYPKEIPIRGQIKIYAPGAEDEWIVGVFGEVMTYITGASPKTGFPGAGFGKGYNRRNLLIYKKAITNTPPTEMDWIFERIDTGAQVIVRYDLSMIQPPAAPKHKKISAKMVNGKAAPEEIKEWTEYWNDRVKFIFKNADTLEGLFTVIDLAAPSLSE